MNTKKTKLSISNKEKLIIVIIVGILFVILTIIVKNETKTGFRLSCETGELLDIRLSRMPPFCIGCIVPCKGTVQAYVEGRLICNSTKVETSAITPPSSIVVPCKSLDYNIGKNVTVDYTINSSFGYFEAKGGIIKIESKK